jgi:hypothetical protein
MSVLGFVQDYPVKPYFALSHSGVNMSSKYQGGGYSRSLTDMFCAFLFGELALGYGCIDLERLPDSPETHFPDSVAMNLIRVLYLRGTVPAEVYQ